MVLPEVAAAVGRGEADRVLTGAAERVKAPGSGRGGLSRFELSGVPVFGKRALHGGLVARVLRDLYLGSERAVAQIEIARRLNRSSIDTPEVVGIGWRPALLVFSALAILTRALPSARNLYEAAHHEETWRRRRSILVRLAGLVRRMHEAGFLHADLNVTNLVLSGRPPEERLSVIDLDKGRFVARASCADRCRGLARLRRSYLKWLAPERRLVAREEIGFLLEYTGGDRMLLREIRRRLAGRAGGACAPTDRRPRRGFTPSAGGAIGAG
jgi:tRNA A-37 threonylcarbamoyl transferase component Bud32